MFYCPVCLEKLKEKIKKISQKIFQLKENKVNIFLFLFLGLVLMIGLPLNKNTLPQEENHLKAEKLALINGNTLLPIANPINPEPKVVKKMLVVVTAYSSTPWETYGDPFLTAAGTKVKDGIIANNYLPFGTRIKIPELYGDKIFVVEDRMNSQKSPYHIDIWFPSYTQAKSFGVKKTYIEVLES